MADLDLPDVNLWLALIDQDHEFHRRAVEYWAKERALKVAFTRVTMLGLFRLATHQKAMRSAPFTFPEMWRHYERLSIYDDVVFLEEPDIEPSLRTITDKVEFPNSAWTDAYIAAFAEASRCRVVTFDVGMSQFDVDCLILEG
jgi:toxin-antitoxin system PIN domain toxin